MNIHTKLAKQTVEEYLHKDNLPDSKNLAQELLNNRAACFISIHKINNNELRGCIGTISPLHNNLGSEIIANAYEAAFCDPRFSPVSKDELNNLKYSVDVLEEPEAIKSENDLDPKKYGVIVKTFDGRSGLLLPNLEGIDTIDKQIEIARDKAGISSKEDVLLYRFRSKRYD